MKMRFCFTDVSRFSPCLCVSKLLRGRP